MKWKPLFAVLLGLLMVGMTVGSVSAISSWEYERPLPQSVPTGEKVWKIDSITFYYLQVTPYELDAVMRCDDPGLSSCSISHTATRCISVSVSGSLKVDAVVFEAEIGESIGSEVCKHTTCTANVEQGKTLYFYVRKSIPVKKVVQKEYEVYWSPRGGTYYVWTGNTAVAYTKYQLSLECRPTTTPLGGD